LKAKLVFLAVGVCFSLTSAAAVIKVEGGAFKSDNGGSDLQFSSRKEKISVRNVVGSEGENSKLLVKFNGGPALYYENVVGRTLYEGYFTLLYSAGKIKIDCLYVNIRSGMNGILIGKAVCGLDRALDEHYTDLIPKYSDTWLLDVAGVDTSGLLSSPSTSVSVVDAAWSDLSIVRVYDNASSLVDALPRVEIKSKEGSYLFEDGFFYTVYNLPEKNTPAFLERADKKGEVSFKKYDYAALKALLVAPNPTTNR